MTRWFPQPLYFISGASAPADIRGLTRVSVPLGISVPHLSRVALKLLCDRRSMPLIRLFVDSGAFSEVDRTGAVVDPIEPAEWIERVAVMYQLAAAFGPPAPIGDYGPRVWIVAPDKVGDQPETLGRLAAHADVMRACSALGARVVVPIQRGAMTAAAFDRAACEALGFDTFVRGIPGNKIAMPEHELEAFLRARRPSAVHLLGIGPRGDSFGPLTALVRRVLGEVEVTCDSNALAASVGRTNGRGGGTRPLTGWQDAFRAAPSTGDPPPPEWQRNAREMAVYAMFGGPHMHEMVMADLRQRGVVRTAKVPMQLDLYDRVSDAL